MATRRGPQSEDVQDLAAKMNALRAAREQKILKGAVDETNVAITEQETRRTTLRRAQTEGRNVERDAARTAQNEARAMDLDTAAIQRNAAARERLSQIERRQAVDQARALRGARDPMFPQAAGLADETGWVTQYRLRQRLQGVGSRRAGDLQAAVGAGYLPGNTGATRPFSRVQAATLAVEEAEARLAEATKQLSNTRRRKAATEDERLGAVEEQRAARAARDAARLELQSAEQLAEARAQAAAAIRQVAEKERGPGTALIRHPTEFGQPGYGEAHANPNLAGRRVPRTGVAFERDAEGRPQLFSGADAHDRQVQQAMGARAQATGQAAAASQHFAAALTEEEKAFHLETYRQAAALERQLAAETERVTSATQHSAVGMGMASQQMHRHGALTSEFIAAAARGEVTLKELGNQAIITAGKFGGWTLAASGLFLVADAIHKVGQGAIQGSSGVETLRRVINNVNPDQAQQAFADLSRQFNVPIDTAVDAVYRMGQRFHDLPSAVEASKAALYSFKTGEVDVATSTENLLAIVNGFHLGVKDMAGVYDQINQAQNVFGIRIGDTEAGLAKAAGTYRNAGGDLDYLLSVFVAISRATNRSGQEIGTGIARGVNEIRKPINQAKLEAQGVEVNPRDFQSTLQSALKAARRPGADLQQIASGLMGNQYARLIAPVLAEQDVLKQAQEKTSPSASQGSAARELRHVLKQVDEQVGSLGHSLERLGTALARSGLLLPLAGLLKGLAGALNLAGRLVETFDKLPHGLRESVAILGEGVLLLRATQRFGGTDRLAGGRLGFLANPDARLKTYAVRGGRDFQAEAYNVQERAARTEFMARERADAARQRANEVHANYSSMQRAGTLPPEFSDERLALEQERIQAEREAGHFANQANRAAGDTVAAKRVAVRAEQQLAEMQALQGQALRRYLHENNVAIPATLQTPSSRLQRFLRPNELPGGARIDQLQFARDYGRISGSQYDEAVSRGYTARAAQMKGRIEQVGKRAGDIAGRTGGIVRSIASVAGGTTARGVSIAEQAAARVSMGSLRALPGRVAAMGATMAAQIGYLDLAFIAIAAWLSLIKPKLDEMQARNRDAEGALAHLPTSAADRKQTDRQLQKAIDRKPNWLERFISGKNDPIVQDYYDWRGVEAPTTTIDRNKVLAAQQQHAERTLAKAQQRALRRTTIDPKAGVVGDILGEDAKDFIGRIGDDVSNGMLTLGQAQHALGNVNRSIQNSARISPRGKAKLAGILQETTRQILAQTQPGNFEARFGGANADEMRQWMGVTTGRLGTAAYRPRRFDFRELSSEYNHLRQQQANARTPADLQKVAQDRDNFYKTFSDTASRQVTEGLALARNEGDRRAAFAAARGTIGQETRYARGEVERAKAAVARAKQGGDTQEIQKAQHDLKLARADLADATARQALDLQTIIDQEYQDRQEGRQVRLGLANSRTQDPSVQANNQMKSAKQQVDDARKTYGEHSRQYQQALQAVNEARAAQAQAVLSAVDAANQLLIAQAGSDPIAQARAAEQAANNTLTAMLQQSRQRPGSINPDDIKRQRAGVLTAHTATQDAVRSEAEQFDQLQAQIAQARAHGDPIVGARRAISNARREMGRARTRNERAQATLDLIQAENDLQDALREKAIAQIDLLSSRTTDPVAQARYAVTSARAALRGTHGTARLQAQANLNRSVQAYRDAQLQGKEDTIDFNLQMGRITNQVAISQLQSLLQLHNLTKQQRRDLQLKIKQLQDQSNQEASGFDLDVGGIKLPTIYDIRKAYDPIRKSMRDMRKGAHDSLRSDISTSVANMHDQRTQVAANVNVYVQDVRAAGKVFDALDRAMGTTVAARMRSAGMR
jgi:hypothetical protein